MMEVQTVAFLLREDETCFARMKRGKFAGKLNGYGGKAKKRTDGATEDARWENPLECTRREVVEETKGVVVQSICEVGVIYDAYEDGVPTRTVHVHAVTDWQGVPEETEETGPPVWYPRDSLPLDELPDPLDALWLPKALQPNTFVVVNKHLQLVHEYRVSHEQALRRLLFCGQPSHV